MRGRGRLHAAEGWRNEAASSVMAERLPELGLSGHALIVDDDVGVVSEAVRAIGMKVHAWHRRARRGDDSPAPSPSAWIEAPKELAFDNAIVRLPSGREALEMILHAAVARLRPGGSLFVYGTNDEGIRSAVRPIAELCGEATTVDTRRHSRVIGATRPADIAHVRGELASWRRMVEIELPATMERGDAVVRQMVSYPGVFAHGRLDAGTGTLLSVLATLPSLRSRGVRGRGRGRDDAGGEREGGGKGDSDGQGERLRVLDFGCGIGVIGAAVLALRPDADVDLLDVYALAIEAARENVPSAHAVLGDGWQALSKRGRGRGHGRPRHPEHRDARGQAREQAREQAPEAAREEAHEHARYDLIVSNPPFHSGKGEDFRVLSDLIAGAPAHLREGGELVIVVQRTVPANQLLTQSFRAVERIFESTQFTVWRATGRAR